MIDLDTELEQLLDNFQQNGRLFDDDFEEAQECADSWHEYSSKQVNE